MKSVIVPNTGRLKGIPAAAAAGIVAGEASKILEVIAQVSDVQREQIREYLEQACFVVKALENGDKLDVRITVSAKRAGSGGADCQMPFQYCACGERTVKCFWTGKGEL